jgi:hypothetical protein
MCESALEAFLNKPRTNIGRQKKEGKRNGNKKKYVKA